jgi:hypothetical protein
MPVTKDTRPEYQIEKQINMVMNDDDDIADEGEQKSE